MALGLLAGNVATTELLAQEIVTVSGEVTCSDCVITLDTVLTIGGYDGPGLDMISLHADVAVDHRGRVYVADFMQPEIAVFDSTGTFLQTLGGRGEGPGEYNVVYHIDAGPRYIHVFDRNRGRTLLDYDFNVVGTHRFPGFVDDSFVTGSDEVVWIGDVPTSASAGHDIHILRLSGEIESFGGDRSVSVFRGPGGNAPAVTGRAETVWAVERRSTRLTRWDLRPEPHVAKVFERTVVEFANANPEGIWPATINAGVMLDHSGIWIVWNARDPDWNERLKPMSPPPPVPPRKVWDGWVELVDPSTGRTLARHRNDGVISGVAHGSRYLVGHSETDAGVPYMHLLQPTLSSARRQ